MAYDEDVAARIREAVATATASPEFVLSVSEQKMFGGLGFLVGGNMAVAASGSGPMMVRCDPSRTAELMSLPGTSPMQMGERATAGWLLVDLDVLESDEALAEWVERGVGYAASLPAKDPNAPKKTMRSKRAAR